MKTSNLITDNSKKSVKMYSLKTGQIGKIVNKSREGEYVLMDLYGNAILLNSGDMFSSPIDNSLMVDFLPTGTIITLEVI